MKAVESERGDELLARLLPKAPLELLEPKLLAELRVPNVVELSGETGSGKTELLYHFITKCISSPTWKEVTTHGLNSSVIFIDADHHFSILRLTTIIEKSTLAYYDAHQGIKDSMTKKDLRNHIKSCLSLLRVIQCYSSEDLFNIISFLDDKNNTNGALLIIDSISAFYWSDKTEKLQGARTINEYYSLLVTKLKKLITTRNMILIATKQLLWRPKSESNQSDFMGGKWQHFVNHSLKLKKRETLMENPESTLIEVCSNNDEDQSVIIFKVSRSGIEIL